MEAILIRLSDFGPVNSIKDCAGNSPCNCSPPQASCQDMKLFTAVLAAFLVLVISSEPTANQVAPNAHSFPFSPLVASILCNECNHSNAKFCCCFQQKCCEYFYGTCYN